MPQFLKYADLEKVGITYSEAYIRQLEAQGNFPRRIRGIGTGPAWAEADIKQYLENKIAASHAA
jgi:predicted DNA-binding transcriptional regulator AlpA